MKKIFLILLSISLIFFSACSKQNETVEKIETKNEINTTKIVTTVAPIASIIQYIWGEYVSVDSLIEPGFSPHTFDLKPSQLIAMEKADYIIATGLSIDNFIEKNTQEEKHILLKDYVNLMEWEEHNHDHHNEDHHDEHNDEHHDEHWHDEHHDDHWHIDQHKDETLKENTEIFYDPHLWLSLENGVKIAEKITEILSKKDPENKVVFEQNLTDFKAKAEKIKNNFVKNTENKKLNNFVIFHEAYGYLFHEMNIDVSKVVVLQETAGRETSVNEMKHIIDEIKEHNVKVLYKEPQLDTKLINTLVEKHNLELSELDPLGKTIEKNWYFDTIEQNLNNLLLSYE